MKKRMMILFAGLVLSSFLITGCAKTTAAAALSEAAKLVVGTMKLDGTAQVVTTDQAKTLIPLWQAYQVLANSSTAAQAEKDALLAQIKAAMTTEQLKAIDAMNLKESDLQSLFTQRGFNPTYEGTRGARTPSSNLQPPTGSEGGGSRSNGSSSFPMGEPGGVPIGEGGGGFVMGGEGTFGAPGNQSGSTPNASQQSTAEAMRSNMASSPFIYNLIVRYLEGKVTVTQ